MLYSVILHLIVESTTLGIISANSFNFIFIILVILPPTLDQSECISSKILPRLRRSGVWVEVGECLPKAMEMLPKRKLLF